ncbi:MAG TPA: metalloprotease PmbA [Gammaproteobacteria bacterium]
MSTSNHPLDVPAVQASLESTAEQAVRVARSLGADQAEAGLSYDEGLSVTVRMGELESVERQRDRALAITVYVDGRKGSASTTRASDEALKETAAKALSIASFTAKDEYAGLADAELMASEVPDLDLCHPWELQIEAAEDLAREAEDAARAEDGRIRNSEGASVSTGIGVQVYANSHGFCGGYPTTNHSLGCGVVAESDGVLERDYWYSAARDAADLESAEQVGKEAAKRTLRRLDARQIKTCQVPVVYPAELARGLFGHLIAAIRGTSQYRGASFLLNASGEQVFPEFVQVEEDPFVPGGMASAPFDNEGVATRKRILVESGVLTGYVLSSYSARRLGLVTTGNAGGVHNLIVAPTAGPLEELLAAHNAVFMVGELLGQGVNTVTGDYSRGAAGFWVEKGEIVHAVHEVTIAGNLKECFREIQAIGSDVDLRGTVRCGSVLVDGLTVAGN